MSAHFCISFPCPLCHPAGYPMPQAPQYIVSAGCICPPTSEKTCWNPMCPRKNHLSATGRTPDDQ